MRNGCFAFELAVCTQTSGRRNNTYSEDTFHSSIVYANSTYIIYNAVVATG